MPHEQHGYHPPQAELLPLSSEQNRNLGEYTGLMSKVNNTGTESLSPAEHKRILMLIRQLGAETIRAHLNAYDTNGPIFPSGYESKKAA